MSDPERLSITSGSELERLLLRSGRAHAPADARRRAIVAATAALGAAGLARLAPPATGSPAASGLAAKTGTALTLKWLVVVGLTGLGAILAVVAIEARRSHGEPHPVAEPRPAVAPPKGPVVEPRPAPLSEPSPSASVEAAPEATTLPSPPAAPLPASRPPARAPVGPGPHRTTEPAAAQEPAHPNETSVHDELATLERARSALAAGDATRALSILDAYSVGFPRASMADEATVLRIEALARAGDMAAAHRVGDAFLASRPQSPYTAHIHSLLGASKP